MEAPEWSKFKSFLPGIHQPTIKNLYLITLALIQCRSTNINTLKDALPRLTDNKDAQPASNYKRLLRFFNHPKASLLIEHLLGLCYRIIGPGRIRMLTLDRTNWQLGSKNINLLVLCYVYKGISIPLRWCQLDKQGSSTQQERQALLDKAIEIASLSSALLLADREFIGEDWISYLVKARINFMIRLPKSVYHEAVNETGTRRHRMLLYKAKSKRGLAFSPIRLKGHRLFYIILKSEDPNAEEPLLYFLTNQRTAMRRKRLEKYRQRWTIECLFKHLKTNGFNLELLNFKSDLKIELMMALVVLAYCLSIYEALQHTEPESIKMKNYKKQNVKYIEQSVFRIGLSLLLRGATSFEEFCKFILRIVVYQHVCPEPKTVQ